MQPKRLVLFLIWLMMAVAYLDRVNISIAEPVLTKALHLSKAQFGLVLSSFTLGYALMQIPGGRLADRFGARPLLVSALVIWSAFTALTGATRSLFSLATVRVLFGLGEGIENGAQFKLIGDWFGSRERSSANAFFLTALALGPAFGLPAAAWLLRLVGWRGLFAWFALPGLVVALLLFFLLPAAPAEAAHTEVTDTSGKAMDWRGLLGRSATWLSFGAYLFFNIAFWGFLGWMPTYLSETRHITLAHLGWTSSVPYLAGFFGMLACGRLGATTLYRYRAVLTGAAYLVAALGLYAAFTAGSVRPCLAGLSLAAFGLYGGFGPFWAIALDLTPDALRGAFTGFINFGGQIGGFTAPLVVGRIVGATHSFTGGFVFMMAALCLAAVCLFTLQTKTSST